MTNFPLSRSENNGLACLQEKDLKIYSVGISTGGIAEIRMAKNFPQRSIIATTLDQDGAVFASKHIEEGGVQKQIEVKLEDVAKVLPYSDASFDFIYARLVLHYLAKDKLTHALHELYRVLKPGGRMFVVVRSTECCEAKDPSPAYDPKTGMTTYTSEGRTYQRFFHSQESMQTALKLVGFHIAHTNAYHEQLCVDFQRTQPAKQLDALIEVLVVKSIKK